MVTHGKVLVINIREPLYASNDSCKSVNTPQRYLWILDPSHPSPLDTVLRWDESRVYKRKLTSVKTKGKLEQQMWIQRSGYQLLNA